MRLEDQFREYEARVLRYEADWWLDDAAADERCSDPSIRAKVLRLKAARKPVGTECLYYDAAAEHWLPERSILHDAIIDDLVGPIDNAAPRPPFSVAVLLMGLPGSGKTTCLRPMATELIRRIRPGDAHIVDADEVRLRLPEYKNGLGSRIVQIETAKITYDRLVSRSLRHGSHLILDVVGNPKDAVNTVRFLTSSRWTVACLCLEIDVDLAIQRAMKRAVDTGRYVDTSYIRGVGRKPQEALTAIRKSGVPLLGSALLRPAARRGRPPIVVNCDDDSVFGRTGVGTKLWSDGSAGAS